MPVDVLPWDPSLGANPGAVGYNKGCPAGYFAMAVAPDFPGSTPTSGGSAFVCRLLATSNQQTIQSESGESWQETYQRYLDAVKMTLPGGQNPGDPFGWLKDLLSSAEGLLIAGVIGFALWNTRGLWRRT